MSEIFVMVDRERWHLEKSVSVGHLLTTLSMVFVIIGIWYSLAERVTTLEVQFTDLSMRVVALLEGQAVTDLRQDTSLTAFRTEMREDAREIQTKLDRVLELSLRAANLQ